MRTVILVNMLFCLPLLASAQQRLPLRIEYILDEKIGDLDRDGIEEKVMVISLPDSSGKSMRRELRIYKKGARDWHLWITSYKAVLPYPEGGSLGDPFEYIEIEKGILLIRQSGGNAWKWGQTDKYRFQHGTFELVDYSSVYGRPCEYWASFHYNIENRKVVYRKEYEKCSLKKEKAKKEKEHFRHKLKKRITLLSRYETYTSITSPKLKQEIVF